MSEDSACKFAFLAGMAGGITNRIKRLAMDGRLDEIVDACDEYTEKLKELLHEPDSKDAGEIEDGWVDS